MRTEEEIRESLQSEKDHYQQFLELPHNRPYSETHDSDMAVIEGWIEALKWVLESEPITELENEVIELKSEDQFWSYLVEQARKVPPRSWEEIKQDIKESLERPIPFFEYLKGSQMKK